MKGFRSNRGFSLIEVLVAIGVVATGILALLAVFVTGTRSNQHGRDLSRATYYARKISEVIRAEKLAFSDPSGAVPPPASSGLNDGVNQWRAVDANPPIQMATIRVAKRDLDGKVELDSSNNPILDPADDKYERNIRMKRASNNVADYNYDLIVLEVTVRWRDGKTGMGARRVKVSSLLKPGN